MSGARSFEVVAEFGAYDEIVQFARRECFGENRFAITVAISGRGVEERDAEIAGLAKQSDIRSLGLSLPTKSSQRSKRRNRSPIVGGR